MPHRTTFAMLAMPAALAAACTQAPAPLPPDPLPGRYTGVEGMYLVVAPDGSPDRYRLEMQWDLEHRARLVGTRDGNSIVFVRDGVRRTLRPTTGAATGLKYLAEKSDCLTVMPGEGYCRAPANR